MEKIKQKALEHYNRMIALAETRPANECAHLGIMYKEIGEWWSGYDCSYCKEFMKNCNNCSLGQESDTCCCGLWLRMHNCKTWDEWIKWAKRVRQYIVDNG